MLSLETIGYKCLTVSAVKIYPWVSVLCYTYVIDQIQQVPWLIPNPIFMGQACLHTMSMVLLQ